MTTDDDNLPPAGYPASLHSQNVQRSGRSANNVRANAGLVPPVLSSVRSPGSTPHDAHPEAGWDISMDGRPKSTSEPPKPIYLGIMGQGTTSGESGASRAAQPTEAPPTATATRSHPQLQTPATTEAVTDADTIAPLRPSRHRSSTLPLQPTRFRSDVSLIQELRRTSSLLWNLRDYEDPDNDDGDDSDIDNEGCEATGGKLRRHFSDVGLAVYQTGIPAAAQLPPDSATSHNTRDGATKKKSKRNWKFWSKNATMDAGGGSVARQPTAAKSFNPHTYTYKRDGRLPISVKDTSHTGYLAKAVGAAVSRMTAIHHDNALSDDNADESNGSSDTDDAARRGPGTQPSLSLDAIKFGAISRKLAHKPCPKLNIVIMVIGSRGDAQPFLKIGQVLKEEYGHRVRVATHPAFKEFIEKDAGLEFFSVGGDPAELMAFIVKNPGLIPSLASVKSGDIGRRRDSMAEMFKGFWRACVDATDDPNDIGNLKLVGDKEPFIADAIIANPPSFAHIHCAEALGIPLHLMFTFPYTPTQAFPHPLANILKSNVDPGYTNFISYPLIDMMVWQGLGDLVNDLRINALDLDPISMIWAPGAVYRMRVPFTYLFSPGLIPKPSDWGPEIDISGFVFMDLASAFTPPPSLEAFLTASPEPPIYIGFGSIVVDDPDSFTEMIFEATRLTGVRALVSRGWGGLGGKAGSKVPDNIYLLDNTPHDWLFPKVRAAIIHGGAGTTAISLKCGLPTMAVPFFGDQYFWGSILEKTKVGPKPIPYKKLTAEHLAEVIEYLLSDEARTAAHSIAKSIEIEGNGAENACRSFHRTLDLEGHQSMRCSIFPDRVAVWWRKGSNIKLSAFAADILVGKGYMTYRNLKLIRHTDWNDFEGPGEPITAMFGSVSHSFREVISAPIFSATGRIIKSIAKTKEAQTGKNDKHTDDIAETAATATTRNANSHTGQNPASPGAERASQDATEIDSSFSVPKKADEGSFEVVFSAVGKSVGQSAVALALAPIEFYFALCQGFHNAPRLYGDDTVRRPPHVSGIRSGLVAARNEFAYGIYDGVTGVVRLPIRWARNDGGVRGFIKGTGMGLMGFVLKDISAILSPFGYVMKGLAKQAKRAKQPTRYLRRARMAQGQRELRAIPDKDQQQYIDRTLAGWTALHTLYRKAQQERKTGGKGLPHKDDGNRGGTSDLAKATRLRMTRSSTAVSAAAAARRGSNDSVFQHYHRTAVGLRHTPELDAAMENADLATLVLSAMRKGETLESVVQGRHACRRTGCQQNGRSFSHRTSPPERNVDRIYREQLAKEARADQEDGDEEECGNDRSTQSAEEPASKRPTANGHVLA